MEMTIRKWVFNYKLCKTEFWILIITLILFPIMCIMYCSTDNADYFNQAISEYEQNTGIKIYPYGRECLKKAAKDCKNKEEVYSIIVNNEKWFK